VSVVSREDRSLERYTDYFDTLTRRSWSTIEDDNDDEDVYSRKTVYAGTPLRRHSDTFPLIRRHVLPCRSVMAEMAYAGFAWTETAKQVEA
jgi:hypothetical protein